MSQHASCALHLDCVTGERRTEPRAEHGTYRLVRPDWALMGDGSVASDVIAVEHVKADGSLCLVFSTTLEIYLNDLTESITRHESECR